MTCEEAKAREQEARKRLLEAEREVLSTNEPLLGKVTAMTADEVQIVDDVANRSGDARGEWIQAARAWLAAKELHRD